MCCTTPAAPGCLSCSWSACNSSICSACAVTRMDRTTGAALTTLHKGSPGWGDKYYIFQTGSGVEIS